MYVCMAYVCIFKDAGSGAASTAMAVPLFLKIK